MSFCKNWGGPGCPEEISKYRQPEHKDREFLTTWPIGEDLREADEICKDCIDKKFKFTDVVCPKCKNGVLKKRKGTCVLGTQDKKGNIYWSPKEVIYYQCTQCGELTIEEELINL